MCVSLFSVSAFAQEGVVIGSQINDKPVITDGTYNGGVTDEGEEDEDPNEGENPLGLIKELLGIDLDPSQLGDVVKGVTGQLGDITGDAAKEAGGILNKILGIFKKN